MLKTSKRILWLDNDVAFVRPYVEALEASRYDVTVVPTVSEAARQTNATSYDLIILDVMVPTKAEQEESDFPPSETDFGTKTGLVFYRRLRVSPNITSRVFVLTVILDETVKDEFLAAGLPDTNFATKLALRNVNDFLKKVELIMSRPL